MTGAVTLLTAPSHLSTDNRLYCDVMLYMTVVTACEVHITHSTLIISEIAAATVK